MSINERSGDCDYTWKEQKNMVQYSRKSFGSSQAHYLKLVTILLIAGIVQIIPNFKLGLVNCQEIFLESPSNSDYAAIKASDRSGSSPVNSSATPIVTLKQGKYIGEVKLSRNGREYFSFVGLRYAKTTERFQQVK
jgi:hypothetical protein